MTNAIFITVRSASTRLPNKCLLKINNITNIERLIRSVKKSKNANMIILCTTLNQEDDILCEIATKEGIEYFRGSEKDKIDRWYQASKKFNVDYIVTADGDDLFCEPMLIDLAFKQLVEQKCDFIEEKPGYSVPIGAFTYAFTSKALERVWNIKDSTDTEMMSVYFTESGLFTVDTLHNIPQEFNYSEIRMTLDYEQDFMFFKKVIINIKENYTLYDIIEFLNNNKEVIAINQYLTKSYLENQKNKTKLVLKENNNNEQPN